MNALALQRTLAYYAQRLGRLGLLGLGLMLLAGLLWITLVRNRENEIGADQRRLQALRQQVAAKSNLPLSTNLNREEQLRIFYKNFGQADKVPQTLQRIYKAAEKQGLLLETGEYTRLPSGSERLARFRVSLPVKGSFKQLLGWMDQVLQENNTVALENAVFKRDQVDDEAIEAKIAFLVFMDTQP